MGWLERRGFCRWISHLQWLTWGHGLGPAAGRKADRVPFLLQVRWEKHKFKSQCLFVFCAIGESTVSQGSFQHPDGQKVVSEPQVRGHSTADAEVYTNASGGFQWPRFLSHVQTPSPAWHPLCFPHYSVFSYFFLSLILGVGRRATFLFMFSPPTRVHGGRGGRAEFRSGLRDLSHPLLTCCTKGSPRLALSWGTLGAYFFFVIFF